MALYVMYILKNRVIITIFLIIITSLFLHDLRIRDAEFCPKNGSVYIAFVFTVADISFCVVPVLFGPISFFCSLVILVVVLAAV